MSERTSSPYPPDRPTDPGFEKARALDGPLSAKLAAYNEMLRERVPAAGAAYQELVDHLTRLKVGKESSVVGEPLPPFLLPDENGKLVSSKELIASGPMVVSFNRGNWCPYCWLELDALEACYPAIVEVGASVVSITPEIATFSRRLKRRLNLSFPVLTDIDNGYALELGLVMALTDEVRSVYEKAGIDLGSFQRNDCWFLPLPTTLVVDREGIVRLSYVNADFRERMDPALIPELLCKL